MCMTKRELKQTSNKNLLEFFEKAVYLETKQSGNGKSPFDKRQLGEELLKRMGVEKMKAI